MIINVKIVAYDRGGDGRYRPFEKEGLINVDAVSAVVFPRHITDFDQAISIVTMKSGEKLNVVGSLMTQLSACLWVEDAHKDCWDTNCGEKYVIMAGSPKENNMRFCPFCGRTLEEM